MYLFQNLFFKYVIKFSDLGLFKHLLKKLKGIISHMQEEAIKKGCNVDGSASLKMKLL